MNFKSIVVLFAFCTASSAALAAPKEACYVLKTQDNSNLTLEVPTEVCIERLYVAIDDKLVLANSRKNPALVVDFSLTQLRKTGELSYSFSAVSELLEVSIADCEKTESVKLEVSGSTNEYGETNPTLLQVRVHHKIQDKLCTERDSQGIYQYVLKTQ
jgi:hypothetical protein